MKVVTFELCVTGKGAKPFPDFGEEHATERYSGIELFIYAGKERRRRVKLNAKSFSQT